MSLPKPLPTVHPKKVKLVEVSPRDGLQNEPTFLPTELKIQFIERLAKTGLSTIEATSFVSPKKVPQLGDHTALMAQLTRSEAVTYTALVPNERGMQAALAANLNEVAIFTAVSETFTKKNIDCRISESFDRFKPVIKLARQHNLPVRAYLSCCFGCPYEGDIAVETVREVATNLLALGCYEISLGDTIGVATPKQVQVLLTHLLETIAPTKLAGHFHDTHGQAIANIYEALHHGITTFDASIAGLGGCPYANGASGNVATEQVCYLMQGLGIETGIDLEKLTDCATWIRAQL